MKNHRINELLTGKWSSWTANLAFFILNLVLSGIGTWVAGNPWIGASIFLLITTSFLAVRMWQQKSYIQSLETYKAGHGFQIIRLDGLDLVPVAHRELPKGMVWLRWVPFFVSSTDDMLAVKAIQVRPTPENKACLVDICVGLDQVSEVYMLITADYGVKSYQGASPGEEWDEKLAGHIELIFNDGNKQEFELRLGHDIRDFHFGNQPWAIDALRKEGTTSFQVWHSTDQKHTLDMVVVHVKEHPRALDRIRIIAEMETGVKPVALWKDRKEIQGLTYPAIQLFGVTVRKIYR